MNQRSVRFILAAGVIFFSSGLVRAQVPSMDDIRAMNRDKQYRSTLQLIAKVLAAPVDKQKGYDRNELFMTRGECLIQLKDAMVARTAFLAAADESDDPKKIGVAQALASLCFRSPNGNFVRRHLPDKAKPQPINILDEANRPAAFKELLEDELLDIEKPYKDALAAKALPDVAKQIAPLQLLSSVEVMATESDTRTAPMLKSLQDHAKKLIEDALKTMEKRAQELFKLGNTWQEVTDQANNGTGGGGNGGRVWEKRGLFSTETRELKDDQEVCRKIITAVHQLSDAFGKKSKNVFSSIPDECDKTYKEIEKTLKGDYGGTRFGRP